ncbi:hypothetical protein TWF718_000642 [Orbilia javanica]|uniref:Uncharacterized protein n=1 Tax=Orbilia javanica TaxID=47235 RepID=A0AAN8MXE6_9PEZI
MTPSSPPKRTTAIPNSDTMSNMVSNSMPPASSSVATGAPTMEGVRDIVLEGWAHNSSLEDVVEAVKFTYMGVAGGREAFFLALTDLIDLGGWVERLGRRALVMEREEAEEESEVDEGEGGVTRTKGKGRKRGNLEEEAKKRRERKVEKRAKEVKAQGIKEGGGEQKGKAVVEKGEGGGEKSKKGKGGEEGKKKGEKKEGVVTVAAPQGGPMMLDDPMDIDPVEPDIVEPLVGAMRRLVVDVWSVHLPSDIAGALVRGRPYQRGGGRRGAEDLPKVVPGEGHGGQAEGVEGEEGEERVCLKVYCKTFRQALSSASPRASTPCRNARSRGTCYPIQISTPPVGAGVD